MRKGMLCVIAAASALLLLAGCGSSRYFGVETIEGGMVYAEARNAAPGSGGTGQLTISEGQVLEARVILQDDSRMGITVAEKDSGVPVLDVSVFDVSVERWEIPPGTYVVGVNVEERATGSVTIQAADAEE